MGIASMADEKGTRKHPAADDWPVQVNSSVRGSWLVRLGALVVRLRGSSDDWDPRKSWKWYGCQRSYDGNEDEGDAKDWREPQPTAKPETTQTQTGNKGNNLL